MPSDLNLVVLGNSYTSMPPIQLVQVPFQATVQQKHIDLNTTPRLEAVKTDIKNSSLRSEKLSRLTGWGCVCCQEQ